MWVWRTCVCWEGEEEGDLPVLAGRLAGSLEVESGARSHRRPPLLLQVSPHRKGKRSATKFIRFVPVVSQCSQCGRVFAQQSLPSKCKEEACPAFRLRARPAAADDAA